MKNVSFVLGETVVTMMLCQDAPRFQGRVFPYQQKELSCGRPPRRSSHIAVEFPPPPICDVLHTIRTGQYSATCRAQAVCVALVIRVTSMCSPSVTAPTVRTCNLTNGRTRVTSSPLFHYLQDSKYKM